MNIILKNKMLDDGSIDDKELGTIFNEMGIPEGTIDLSKHKDIKALF
jgi:hypothetical protein